MQDFRPQLHCCYTRYTMAGTGSSRQPKFLSVFQRLSIALSNHDQCFCLKPKQVQCFESLIDGSDVITPLNLIIEDQLMGCKFSIFSP